MQRMNEKQPWMNYVDGADIAEALEKATSLGGKVAPAITERQTGASVAARNPVLQ
ncbi:MAG: hypothetical protein U0793_24515 [Gemmataceae bacterium]